MTSELGRPSEHTRSDPSLCERGVGPLERVVQSLSVSGLETELTVSASWSNDTRLQNTSDNVQLGHLIHSTNSTLNAYYFDNYKRSC